ncbi:hypothetical protein HanXRQr2_Chr01g0021851 [Helianthus annuus]|uniref:Uncharacterized protein n=1 Tax=Helianthus annuus TaxID=4232 RepID=A0A9K3P2W1_HELAN|nr:hypothetical protein HanXRQr2_Chr01g0021851 [Helianthus annuus]KAJ0480683.1 hypothetical protein HanIR_Chr13g0634461 [Helianthus annuus]
MTCNAPLQKCLLYSVTSEGCLERYLCSPQCFYNCGTSTWFFISGYASITKIPTGIVVVEYIYYRDAHS